MKCKNSSKYLDEFEQFGKLKSIKIIDTHTHMGDIYGATTPISSIEDCIKLMDDENIDSIWCAPHSDLFSMTEVNSTIAQILKKYAKRVKGYFAFNPNYYDRFIDRLGDVLSNNGYIGLKILPAYHNYALDGEAYAEALKFADKHHLVVLCHTWGKTKFNSTKEVRKILEKYNNLQLIMGHSAPNELDEAIEIVNTHSNVYLDLCDIHRHSGIVEKMVNSVGSNKILFGTDLPWYDPNYCIGSVLCAHISDSERENIFYKNAENMLKNIKK